MIKTQASPTTTEVTTQSSSGKKTHPGPRHSASWGTPSLTTSQPPLRTEGRHQTQNGYKINQSKQSGQQKMSPTSTKKTTGRETNTGLQSLNLKKIKATSFKRKKKRKNNEGHKTTVKNLRCVQLLCERFWVLTSE